MTITFYDTECNSLDTDGGFIQEIAWANYHAESKRLINCESHILQWTRGYLVDDGAFEATGLSRDFCQSKGAEAQGVLQKFLISAGLSDAICGHNIIDYDNKMLASNVKRTCFVEPEKFLNKFMIDTMYDLPFTKPQKHMTLEYLAMKHGYIMSNAHQAMADVFACAHIFFQYPLDKILEIASTPIIKLHGYTEYLDEAGREKFYKAKFRWSREAKRWEKTARAYYIPGTQLELKEYNLYSGDSIIRVTDTPAEVMPF